MKLETIDEKNDVKRKIRRQKRVKRIKVYLVVFFLVMTITPMVLSIITLRNLLKLQENVEELTDRFNKYELSLMLKEEAERAREEEEAVEEEAEEVVEEPEQLHFEYYKDGYVVPDDFKRVYLTFDDGPSMYTTQILDILDSYGVKATFFVTAYQVDNHPEWYKEIVDRGHSIGMHSYTHVYNSIYASEAAFVEDLIKIHDCVQMTTGVDCKLYRFPGGSSNAVSSVPMQNLCKIVNDNGWRYFDWNVSSQDASNPSPGSDAIVNNVISGIAKNDNNVVLMHDAADKYGTVQALPQIIEKILAMDKTVILPISDASAQVQHLSVPVSEGGDEEDTGADINE